MDNQSPDIDWYEFLPYIYSGQHFPQREECGNVDKWNFRNPQILLDLATFSDIIENDVF